MSIKNPNVMPGNKGRVTHKRFPRQVRTRKAVERLNALRPSKTVVSA